MIRKKSFTIIELLVVIAILTIIAALLMPALIQARGQAKHVSCANNLRQITMAYMLYANDNDGFCCWYFFDDKANNIKGNYQRFLAPYGVDASIRRCPEAQTATYWNPSYGQISHFGRTGQDSRGCFIRMADGTVVKNDPPFKFDHIRNPDRRYLNGESISYKLNTYTVSPPGWPRSAEEWLVRQPYCAAPLRHGQRNANYAFLDTHIQTLGYRQAFGYFYDPDNMP